MYWMLVTVRHYFGRFILRASQVAVFVGVFVLLVLAYVAWRG